MRCNILISDETIRRCDEAAKNLCITRSAYINMVLARHFTDADTLEKMPEILAGLRDILERSETIQKRGGIQGRKTKNSFS